MRLTDLSVGMVGGSCLFVTALFSRFISLGKPLFFVLVFLGLFTQDLNKRWLLVPLLHTAVDVRLLLSGVTRSDRQYVHANSQSGSNTCRIFADVLEAP